MLSLFPKLLLAPLLAAVVQADNPWTVGQIVKTSGGSIQGHASRWKSEVSEYLGIPFAQPPVKDLRFAAPKAYRSDKNFVASKFSATCPTNLEKPKNTTISYETSAQTILGLLGQINDTFNEDCLTLNVWSKPQTGEKAKAVLVWIYGGGYNSGNTNSPMYNGARLANDNDVVLVSINYRTNIFGFPRAPFLPDLNLGLLDQRLGLEWVRDNIAGFGGDPKRITLFGQSAGAGSVDMHSFAWAKEPIAAGFIAESGSVSLSLAGPSGDLAAGWYAASQKLGCGGASAGEATLACMRKQKWEDITNAIEKRRVTPNTGSGGFGPTADGKVVFSDYAQRRAKGQFAKVPILVGNANNEGGLYVMLGRAKGQSSSSNATAAPSAPPVANMIGCGSHPTSKARRDQAINSWRYLYAGEFPNLDITIPGAYHTSEIPMVFGTSQFLSHRPDTAEEKKLSEKVRKAWTDFAKDPINGLLKLGWPLYNSDQPTVIRIGNPNSSEIAFESRQKYDAQCPTARPKF